ncbi:hypothetical protein [Mycobacterium lepromatosis]|uniref:hypothetical protein n=1 Tax=Mycobacterium lepromatosis TaxID=480418 RepID=UPI0012E00FD3|nr:hypothetical protein [Mycobacterium lepromatosis]
MGDADREHDTGQHGIKSCRQHSAGLTFASLAGCRAGLDAPTLTQTALVDTEVWTYPSFLANRYTRQGRATIVFAGQLAARRCRGRTPTVCAPAMSRSGRPFKPVSK